MIRSIFALLFCVALHPFLLAQPITVNVQYSPDIPDAGERLIGYSVGSKLSIDDFLGKPVANSIAAAITNTGIMFTSGFHQTGNAAVLDIVVYCSFNRSKSWMKEAAKTPYILTHEQHHFDICFLGALNLVHQLRNTRFTVDDYRTQMKEVYEKAVAEMNALQQEYDGSTGHGTVPTVQAAWNNRIDAQLATLAILQD